VHQTRGAVLNTANLLSLGSLREPRSIFVILVDIEGPHTKADFTPKDDARGSGMWMTVAIGLLHKLAPFVRPTSAGRTHTWDGF
jgi:hypothetical protein